MNRRDFIKKLASIGLTIGAAEALIEQPIQAEAVESYDELWDAINKIQARLDAIEKTQREWKESHQGGYGWGTGTLYATGAVFRNRQGF